MCAKVLNRRVPLVQPHVLNEWWDSDAVVAVERGRQRRQFEVQQQQKLQKQIQPKQQNGRPPTAGEGGGGAVAGSFDGGGGGGGGLLFGGRARALRLVLGRARANLAVLEKLDLVNRFAESARLYGIPFFDVVVRGSQYRVEAVLFRVMKPLRYAAITAGSKKVANQPAIEVRPRTLHHAAAT